MLLTRKASPVEEFYRLGTPEKVDLESGSNKGGLHELQQPNQYALAI